jgi:hypothetical protein
MASKCFCHPMGYHIAHIPRFVSEFVLKASIFNAVTKWGMSEGMTEFILYTLYESKIMNSYSWMTD